MQLKQVFIKFSKCLIVLVVSAIFNIPYGFSLPRVEDVERCTGYRFRNPGRIAEVFTHPSANPENGRTFNRLEKLGDAVLRASVVRGLFERHPVDDEATLHTKEQALTSNDHNARVLQAMGLAQYAVHRVEVV